MMMMTGMLAGPVIVNGLPDPFALISFRLPCWPFPPSFLGVTLHLCTLPLASPSTGRTQTPKEADAKADYAIIHKNWNGIEIEIRWIADYVSFDDGQSMAHLEVESVKPARAPLPITETGYRSHFINRSNVDHMGGPEAYVEAWIDEMSHTPWRDTAAASCQLALL